MTKISLIQRPHPIPLRASIHICPNRDGRRVAVDALNKAQLHLVPTTARATAESRIARFRRVIREYPYLVDAGFLALTMAIATLLWWCGK